MDRARPTLGPPGNSTGRQPRIVCADRLFGDDQELRIHYRGQEYRLRKTRSGKLILTK
jgi:hemin uptake protein HemP